MAVTGSYRTSFTERDLSGFVLPTTQENGAMVIISSKGRGDKPIKCTSENDVIKHFGYPNSTYWNVFEAIAYARQAPLWCISAIGDNALFGGIDVKEASVVGFGAGRVHPDNFNYTLVNTSGSYIIGTGDGKTAQFAGTIPDTPLDEGTLKIKIGTSYINVEDSDGDISGDDIDSGGTNTIVYASGAIDFTLDGTLGTQEDTDIQCEADSSGSLNNKYWWLFTSTTSYYIWYNVNSAGSDPDPTPPTGAPTTTVGIEVAVVTDATADAVASATQSEIDSEDDFSATVITDTVTVIHSGAEAVRDAEDGNTGWTDPISVDVQGVDPDGAIPKVGENVTLEYVYNEDISTTVSHSLFASSPYDDDLAVEIEYLTGKQFKLTLYRVPSAGTTEIINEYEYSLVNEKNNFGKSLYIHDIFKNNPYIIPVINNDYVWSDPTFSPSIVNLTGGSRGDTPQTSHFNTAWDYFKKPNRYPVKNFMDVNGNSATKLKDLRDNYQYYSHCITCVPLGNDSESAVTVRQGLGIDDDHLSLYTNWSQIEDPYNNSFAWISQIGSVGTKYAMMEDVYDALSPAGDDEDGHGGILQIWKVIEMEEDYDDTALQELDDAQINPIIKDDAGIVKIYGDKTLKISLSDTSYVGTRRLYNLIIEKIIKNILRRQEFKNNDDFHRLKARSMADDYMRPIASRQFLRDYYVQCDTNNNDDTVLEQRKFILDVYVKVTPNSQFVQLRFTRLSQTQILAEFIT